jgi:hypothetical protein
VVRSPRRTARRCRDLTIPLTTPSFASGGIAFAVPPITRKAMVVLGGAGRRHEDRRSSEASLPVTITTSWR